MSEMLEEWKTPSALPPAHMHLPLDEIHLWRVPLNLPEHVLHSMSEILSTEERNRLDRFQFQHLRRRFLASHGALRLILSAYSGIPPDQITFVSEKYGKPRLARAPQSNPLAFNLAHSHELALIAIAINPVIGVDVEFHRDIADADQIARRFFSKEEYEVYIRHPAEGKQTAFFRCWTRKEAFIKAIGDGLSYPLDQFSVTFSPAENPRLLHIAGSREAALEWSLFGFEPGEEYTAALAVKGKGFRLSFWQWMNS